MAKGGPSLGLGDSERNADGPLPRHARDDSTPRDFVPTAEMRIWQEGGES